MEWSSFLEYVILAVSLGGIYALMSIGYTIIYGVLKLINIAHGDLFMLAGFMSLWAVQEWGLPLWLGYATGIVITVVVGLLVERVAYRPLTGFKMSAFTSTVAVSMIIQAAAVIFLSPRSKPFPRPEILQGVMHFGEVSISAAIPFVIGSCVILFAILILVINRTRIGVAMRALSEDRELVELMGVRVDKVVVFSFILSIGYAAAGAIVWGQRYPSFNPFVGAIVGLKGFVGAVVGGIGSIAGAMLGGFVLGVAEIALVGLFPQLSNLRDVFAYALMIGFLLFRPGGILNVKVIEEKV
jgi:branched-chain amino acid transport system permease protein